MQALPFISSQPLPRRHRLAASTTPARPPPRPPPHPLASPTPSDPALRLLRTAAIAAATTAVTQLVNAPLTAMQTRGPAPLFSDLPLHLLKRVPTKTLTTLLTTLTAPCPLAHSLSSSVALLATYPLHSRYYAARKHIPLSAIRALPARTLYTGVLPALAAALLTAHLDRALFRRARAALSPHVPTLAALAAAASLSAVAAGVAAEPLKAVARKAAVRGARGARGGAAAVAAGLLADVRTGAGVGALWEGVGKRMLRYAVAAPVAKVASRALAGEDWQS